MENLNKITTMNFREYQLAYLMVSENFKIKGDIIKAKIISDSNKELINSNLNNALTLLKEARTKIKDVEYTGGDITVYTTPHIFHTIDTLMEEISSILIKTNRTESDLLDIDVYLKRIEELEK